MSWPLVALKDCCRVVSGGTPKTDIPEYWGGTHYWVTPKDLSSLNSIYIKETPERITDSGLKNSSAEMLPIGSVLFSSRAPIGHIAITSTAMCTNQGFKSFIPGKSVDALYLYFCLKYHTPELQALGNGATFKEVSKRVVEEYKIPLPPLATQQYIARVLEQADRLRKQAQQMESELNQLAQSLFLEMFGDPISNPKGFSKTAITECFDIKTGKLDSNAAVVGGKYPFFTCAREDFWIDEFAFDQKAILLAGNNASADYSVKYYEGKFNAYQRTYIFSLMNDDWSYQYFKAALEFQLANLKRSSKGTNTKYLTMEIFRRIHILIPSEKEQREYESNMQEINLRKTKMQLLQRNTNDLFESLMQRAFNGELTAPERKAA